MISLPHGESNEVSLGSGMLGKLVSKDDHRREGALLQLKVGRRKKGDSVGLASHPFALG